MTFMRKFLDLLNMDNWKKPNDREDYKPVESKEEKNEMPSAKWARIRNAEEMKIEEATIDLQNITIFFKNGRIQKVVPDVYNYYHAQFYNIDGKIFDTYSVNSVKAIPKPDSAKNVPLGTSVYNLEYVLNRRASQERKKGNNELAYALLNKSIDLMKLSAINYGEKNFLRIVNWLYEDGYIEEAHNVEKQLREELPQVFDRNYIRYHLFQKVLEECRASRTDYIICVSSYGTCAECAKYQGRVYSISGRSNKFPPLPKFIKKTGMIHDGCRHSFYPYSDGVNDKIMGNDNKYHEAVSYSNRPFVDNRSAEEKRMYEKHLEKVANKKELEKDRAFYYAMVKKYPNIMPKSLGGYRKMKKANTKGFQELVAFLNSNGIYID